MVPIAEAAEVRWTDAPARFRAAVEASGREPAERGEPTPGERAWRRLIRSRISHFEDAIPSLDAAIGPGPARVEVVVGSGGADDAFTAGDHTIVLDLGAWERAYGPASDPARVDRILAHEYTHLLTRARWPDPGTTALERALWTAFHEGLGHRRSLSPRWTGEVAEEALRRLGPVFVQRLSALAAGGDEASLTADLARGPFEAKWGALPVALWLASEGEEGITRLVAEGPAGVITLAERRLPLPLVLRLRAGLAVPGATAVPSLDPLLAAAKEARVVVLGETHRTVECPALLRALMPRLEGYSVLALEGQEDVQPVVDAVLAGRAGRVALHDAFLPPELADAVMLAGSLGWRVRLVDGPSHHNTSRLGRTRDQRMFDHVAAELDAGRRVLLYVGNTHTTETVMLRDGFDGPSATFDAFVLDTYMVGHLLEVYTGGQSVSVRTDGPDGPLGGALAGRFGGAPWLVLDADSLPLATLRGGAEPNGSWSVALAEAELGDVADWVVALPTLTPSVGW